MATTPPAVLEWALRTAHLSPLLLPRAFEQQLVGKSLSHWAWVGCGIL